MQTTWMIAATGLQRVRVKVSSTNKQQVVDTYEKEAADTYERYASYVDDGCKVGQLRQTRRSCNGKRSCKIRESTNTDEGRRAVCTNVGLVFLNKMVLLSVSCDVRQRCG
jgi:hypothetical protein